MATTIPVDSHPPLDLHSLAYEHAYEIVDGVPVERATVDIVAAAFDRAYEVVDGKLMEWPEMGAYPEYLSGRVYLKLAAYVEAQDLGWAMTESLFRITPKVFRRPDVGFVSFKRWPKTRDVPLSGPWDLCPDLAVEVISKTDSAWDVMAKVREYFDAKVQVVWLIYPTLKLVHVYSSYTLITVVTREQTLDGGAVVPGFQLPLVDLFIGQAEPEPTEGIEPQPGSLA